MKLSTADTTTASPRPSGAEPPVRAKAVWWGTFTALLAILLIRNGYLFVTKIYEAQDFGANTIAILQAKHFALLTGNYSRIGFYHPGPAFLYVEAAGEVVFHDLLHVVPTPWNGQVLAVFILNAALVATAVLIIHRHHRSATVSVVCVAVILLFFAALPLLVNSPWMPYVYFAPTLLLLVSAASVAAGRTADLPLLALAASLCLHGHVEYLLFAPGIVAAALITLAVHRRRTRTGLFSGDRKHWLWGLGVAGVFAVPIILHTLLHWPGEFGRYFSYQNSGTRHRANSPLAVTRYVLHYWWSGSGAGPIAAASLVLAGVLVFTCPRPDLRRFLASALGMAMLLSALFGYYATSGIDNLSQVYVGYFYWSVPLLVLMIIAVGASVRLAGRRVALWAAVAAACAAALPATMAVATRDSASGPPPGYRGIPEIPGAVAVLAAHSNGHPMVITMDHAAWEDVIGLVAYADRHGLRMCLRDRSWAVLARTSSICTSADRRAGIVYRFYTTTKAVPPVGPILARLPGSVVTAANG